MTLLRSTLQVEHHFGHQFLGFFVEEELAELEVGVHQVYHG